MSLYNEDRTQSYYDRAVNKRPMYDTHTVCSKPAGNKLKCSPFKSSLKWHESSVETDPNKTYEELMKESYKPAKTFFSSFKECFIKPKTQVKEQKGSIPTGKISPLLADAKIV